MDGVSEQRGESAAARQRSADERVDELAALRQRLATGTGVREEDLALADRRLAEAEQHADEARRYAAQARRRAAEAHRAAAEAARHAGREALGEQHRLAAVHDDEEADESESSG